MNNKFTGLIAFLLIIILVWINFNFDQPSPEPDQEKALTQFSLSRAKEHVKAIAQEPHYLGSPAHSQVRNYIVDQLQQMGLVVQTQEAYNLNASGILTRPKNILSRIEGSEGEDALVVMTHYDSQPHSSLGASDAGSGVATILEGIRAYLETNQTPKNDIILLFTDAEELGLNGADLFIKDHPWAADAKLALNFEARGSGGTPYMLLETNGKNARLIEAFKQAGVKYPVTNSLYYSIYKMLPNDTDLTVLREQGDINGYNFAFIDDHFDYHTANDTPENLDDESLAHQSIYLMPLLAYFSDADLEELSSDRDLIYLNLPFVGLVSYPFDWIMPMLILAILIFLGLIVYGFKKESLKVMEVIWGFVPLLMSLLFSGLLVWAFWKFCLFIYPEYSEMEHGFTYNGYWYIPIAIFLALSCCFIFYHLVRKKTRAASVMIAPLLLWLSICTILAMYLKGASYLIIPVYFALLHLFIMIRVEHPNRILMVLLSSPAIFVLLTLIYSLPVALGLKMLFVTGMLTSLLFLFFLPVFTYFRKLKLFAILSFLIFNILVFIAHFYNDFNTERPKPNSLVYLKDLDTNTANWYSYDGMIDEWTAKYFGKDPVKSSNGESNFSSKYGSNFTYRSEAPNIELPEPYIQLQKEQTDSLQKQWYSLKIAPNRKVNRMELYETRNIDFEDFRVNSLEAGDVYLGENRFHMFRKRWRERLLTYYPDNRDTLRIEFSIEKGDKPEFVLYESAYDLFENKELNVPERTNEMIPRPFVLNDATILKKTIKLN
ncbi:M20/M25/M40 family metallo-hydrolase [Gramella sp. BOM4]|nr:M20/M25/M40 family metallo-hydrolase [Christiangramia bathymodioli]